MLTKYGELDGTINEKVIKYYTEYAKGGFALIITEATAIHPNGKAYVDQLCLYDDKYIPYWNKLADSVHNAGGKIAVQLHHCGRRGNDSITKSSLIAPSPIPYPFDSVMWSGKRRNNPREMSISEIRILIEAFGDAARRAKDAGLDGVEVHGGHGYLVGQFISPYSNKRTDEYGGDLLGRLQFAVNIIQNIKEKTSSDFPVWIRISAEENVYGGNSIEESKVISSILANAGYDGIDVSVGIHGSFGKTTAPMYVEQGFNISAAEAIKKSVKVPVITVGRITEPLMIEQILLEERANFVALGRASLADPYLPKKLLDGRVEDVCPCIGCLLGCAGSISKDQSVTCLMNPEIGQTSHKKKAEKRKTVLVVGGGPAGLTAARYAALKGHKVELHEKDSLGGAFKVAAIPLFKQEIAKGLAYMIKQAKTKGVSFHLGSFVTCDTIKSKEPDVVIIATGAEPIIPEIKGIDQQDIINSTDVLKGKVIVGDKVLIIGGGLMGCETAAFLADLGKKVTIVEQLDEVGLDVEPTLMQYLFKTMEQLNVEIITNAVVQQINSKSIEIYRHDRQESEIKIIDSLVFSVGVKSKYTGIEKKDINFVDEVYFIGDAKKPRNALDAVREGYEIGIKI